MFFTSDIQHHPCGPNYLFAFQQWLDRPLTRLERRVIEPLEQLRLFNRFTRRPTRVYVDDPGTVGDAIRNILVLYTRWFTSRLTPHHRTVIIARSRKQAREAIRRSILANTIKVNGLLLFEGGLTPQRLAEYRSSGWMQRLTPQLLTGSAKAPDRLRGQTITSALVLDADSHGHSSRPDYAYPNCFGYGYTRRIRFQSFSNVQRVVAALLPQAPLSFTIIHGNPRRHPRSVYAQMRRRSLDPLSRFHLISPLEHTTDPPPPPHISRPRKRPYTPPVEPSPPPVPVTRDPSLADYLRQRRESCLVVAIY